MTETQIKVAIVLSTLREMLDKGPSERNSFIAGKRHGLSVAMDIIQANLVEREEAPQPRTLTRVEVDEMNNRIDLMEKRVRTLELASAGWSTVVRQLARDELRNAKICFAPLPPLSPQ